MTPRLATGWTVLCLAALPGCSQTVEVVDSPSPTPPMTLLQPCPAPQVEVVTHRDLVRLVLELGDALDRCDADKAAMRAFYEELER